MKKNNKGFTLAELLIVVAIIAVLVAIAIPIFTTQLEKSRDSVSLSNIRAAYAEAMSMYLTATEDETDASGRVHFVKDDDTVIVDKVVGKGKIDDPANLADLAVDLPGARDDSVDWSDAIEALEKADNEPVNLVFQFDNGVLKSVGVTD